MYKTHTHIYRMVASPLELRQRFHKNGVLSVNCPRLARLYRITCSQISNIPYNLIFTTKFNDSSILITNISCDYLNLPLANEYVGDVAIPSQVIKYNHNCHQADQPIRLQYLNQIKLLQFVHNYVDLNIYEQISHN